MIMPAQPDPSSQRDGDRPVRFRSGDSTSRRVLDDVLRQTAALYSVEPSSDPADLEAMREVARRLGRVEFQLDPVLKELVAAGLKGQLKGVLQSPDQLDAVAERVARTLFENPDSHARLSALWDRLTAGA